MLRFGLLVAWMPHCPEGVAWMPTPARPAVGGPHCTVLWEPSCGVDAQQGNQARCVAPATSAVPQRLRGMDARTCCESARGWHAAFCSLPVTLVAGPFRHHARHKPWCCVAWMPAAPAAAYTACMDAAVWRSNSRRWCCAVAHHHLRECQRTQDALGMWQRTGVPFAPCPTSLAGLVVHTCTVFSPTALAHDP